MSVLVVCGRADGSGSGRRRRGAHVEHPDVARAGQRAQQHVALGLRVLLRAQLLVHEVPVVHVSRRQRRAQHRLPQVRVDAAARDAHIMSE